MSKSETAIYVHPEWMEAKGLAPETAQAALNGGAITLTIPNLPTKEPVFKAQTEVTISGLEVGQAYFRGDVRRCIKLRGRIVGTPQDFEGEIFPGLDNYCRVQRHDVMA